MICPHCAAPVLFEHWFRWGNAYRTPCPSCRTPLVANGFTAATLITTIVVSTVGGAGAAMVVPEPERGVAATVFICAALTIGHALAWFKGGYEVRR